MKSHSTGTIDSTQSDLDHKCFGDKVVMLIFKFMGLAPLSIVRRRQEQKLTKKNPKALTSINFVYSDVGVLYNVFLMVLLGGINFVSLPLIYESDYPFRSPLTDMIELIQAIFGNAVIIFIWLYLSLRQRTMVMVLNRLMAIDTTVVSLMESSRNYVVLLFLTNSLVWIEVIVSERQCYGTDLLNSFNEIVPGIIVSWLMVQYIVMVKLIEKRFSALNRGLRDNSRSSIIQPIQSLIFASVSVDNHDLSKISTFRRAHTELYEISCEVAEFYSLPSVLMIAFSCYSIIYNAYYLMMPFVLAIEDNTTLMIVNGIFCIIGRMLPITMLALGINRTTAQIGKTAHVVHKLLARSIISREDKFQLKAFSLELLHREVHFTASGLFPLDCTLVHSIFSMVVTYLIILFQFQMTSSWNNKRHSLPNVTTAKESS